MKRNKVVAIFLVCLAFMQSVASMAAGNEVDIKITEADSAYSKGSYADAAALYQSVIDKAGASASLLFNLGNACAKAGDLGSGRLAYERALLIDPSLSNARANLQYVASKVNDNNVAETKGGKVSVVPDVPSFFSTLKDYVTRRHLSDTWAWWAALLFVATVGCVAIYMFTSGVLLRKIGFFGGLVAGLLSIFALICSFSAASEIKHLDEGVVMGYKVKLLDTPSLSGTPAKYPLCRGTLMKVLDVQNSEADGKWYKVRLNSDFVGWISANDFSLINPDAKLK